MNFKAVIFDLDGLLIDSEPVWNKADELFLQGKYTQDLKRKILGMGHREIIELFKQEVGLTGDTDELIEKRRELFLNLLMQNLNLFSGVKDLLENLTKKKYLLAIATGGYSEAKTEEILTKVGIRNYFSTIVSGDEVKRGKPFPDIYVKTAEKLHVEASECLVLEDAPNGIEATKSAGMIAYGVNSDEEIRKKLQERGADKVFSSLLEVKL
jgi:HAD superfamily hydrolase (TIGR01509 family)